MEYRRLEHTVIARLDPGEEIMTQLKVIAEKENIKLASVNALGAVNSFTVGVYDVPSQKYKSNHFEGAFEIVSLTGNINTMNGEYYAHLHMSCGDENGHVFGGHLNEGHISATCEMFIEILDGIVDREKNPNTGINEFRF